MQTLANDRVVSPRRQCPPHYDLAAPWRALAWHNDGTPVRWDVDKPIRWAFNTLHLTQRVVEQVEQAVGRLADSCGFDFVQTDMVTTDPAAWRSTAQAEGSDVLVSCADPLDLTGCHRHVAGNGGPIGVVDSSGRRVYVAGTIRLVSTRTTPGVAIHEWMHVLGLGHVGDPEQQMYWRDTCKGSLGTGDLAGLLAISQPLR